MNSSEMRNATDSLAGKLPRHLAAAILAGTMVLAGPLTAQDTTGPVLTSYTITPGTADVTTGAQNVTVELTITDDSSGVASISCSFLDPAQTVEADLNWDLVFPLGLTRISGDGLNGIYQGTVTVPAFNPPEVWDSAILIVDGAGNGSTYDTIMGGTAFPGGATGQLTVLNSGPVDAAAPVVTAYTLTPDTVDVGPGSQNVAISITVTDDLSGVSLVSLSFYDSLGFSTTNLFWTPSFGSLTRTSGDGLNGTYEGIVTVPAALAPDTWESVLSVQDASGKVRYIDTIFGGEPFPGGGSGQLTIQNTGAPDSTPPIVTSYTLTPGTVDVGMGAQDVTVDLAVTDDVSGLAGITIQFYNSALALQTSLTWSPSAGNLTRISGDELNGTYQGIITIPGYIAADTWDSTITVNDVLLNSRSYDTILLGQPFPGGATGKITVQNSGSVDAADPVLTSISLSPSTVDAGPGNQGVTVSLSATDDVAGVEHLSIDFYNSSGGLVASLSFDGGPSDGLTRVSGDALSGVYEGLLIVSQFAAADTWDSHVTLEDGAGRIRHYGPAVGGDAFPGGVPGQLTVQNSGVSDSTAPALLAFTLTPDMVDVTSGPQDVMVELVVEDDVSGLDEVVVGLFNVATLQTVASASWSRLEVNGLTRFSGDADYGTYRGTLTVPQFVGAGTLEGYVSVTDIAGNTLIYSDFADPFPPGATTEVVVQDLGAADAAAPELTSFSMTPGSVNVSTGSQNVTVSLGATDDLSGVATIVVSFVDSNGGSVPPMDFGGAGNTLALISGTTTDGSYEGTLTVPQYWPGGTWRAVVTVTDRTNKVTEYDRVSGEPFPVQGTDLLTIHNSAPPPSGTATEDTAPPTLTGLTITPGTADVSTDPVDLTIDIDFTDDLSGAEYATVLLPSRHGTFVATNLPAGFTPGYQLPNPAPLVLSSGTSLAGTFSATITIPAGAAPEVIPVTVRITDAAGRTVAYGSQPGETALPAGADPDLSIVNSNATPTAKLDLWTTAFGLSGGDASPFANPSGDGSDNLLKWAFNIDPTLPDDSLLVPGTGTSGLPVDTVILDGANSLYRLEYLRRVGSGLIYTPAITTVLGSWPPVSSQPVIVPIDVNWERVVVEYPFDSNVVKHVYSRVGVTLP